MRVLQKNMKGPDVKQWQQFLIGQGFSEVGAADGSFGEKTKKATMEFQKTHGLDVDGQVGNQTLGKAMMLGFEALKDTVDNSKTGPNFPPRPKLNPLPNTAARQKVFGKFAFKPQPLPKDKEHIRITDGWDAKNIIRVQIPQLIGVKGAQHDGSVFFHQLAAAQLKALWAAWEKAGLLDRVLTYDGAFNPRFVRGHIGSLSNHAFGSAFDINAALNPMGTEPLRVGTKGSVRELVEIAAQFGFFWGGFFAKRRDGMHFEVAKIITP
jgi:peptidoglycan hydrolase-like protein with peptidoglycan-binding domain